MKKHNSIQNALKQFLTVENPQDMILGTDTEYRPEVEMFLDRVDKSMSEEQLLDVIHKVFQEMLNAQEDDTTREKYRPIIHKYRKLRDSEKDKKKLGG